MVAATLKFTTRAYFLLTKPGIIFGNVMTTAAGFALASKAGFNFSLFLLTLLGISLVMGSACVCNNYIDRDLDQKMKRTRNRPLVRGDISGKAALIFAILLGIGGILSLVLFVNLLAAFLGAIGFFVYVALYSFLKYHSVHFTLVGSIAGAIPPVVGYCAVSHAVDLAAIILFAIVVLWQMPHFFAIAIYRLEDYREGKIPVLPVKRGVAYTKVQILFYMIAFTGAIVSPFVCGYLGYIYLLVSSILGGIWFWICMKGFTCDNDRRWARQFFLFSLVVIMGISAVIPFSVLSDY